MKTKGISVMGLLMLLPLMQGCEGPTVTRTDKEGKTITECKYGADKDYGYCRSKAQKDNEEGKWEYDAQGG